jgi:hypothetical protein
MLVSMPYKEPPEGKCRVLERPQICFMGGRGGGFFFIGGGVGVYV